MTKIITIAPKLNKKEKLLRTRNWKCRTLQKLQTVAIQLPSDKYAQS